MKLKPNLASEWTTYGELYNSDDNHGLGEDMFEAELPDGTMIAAGWVPEGDPNGAYQITVTKRLAFVKKTFTTTDIEEALRHIERTAAQILSEPHNSLDDFIITDIRLAEATYPHHRENS